MQNCGYTVVLAKYPLEFWYVESADDQVSTGVLEADCCDRDGRCLVESSASL